MLWANIVVWKLNEQKPTIKPSVKPKEPADSAEYYLWVCHQELHDQTHLHALNQLKKPGYSRRFQIRWFLNFHVNGKPGFRNQDRGLEKSDYPR